MGGNGNLVLVYVCSEVETCVSVEDMHRPTSERRCNVVEIGDGRKGKGVLIDTRAAINDQMEDGISPRSRSRRFFDFLGHFASLS